MTETDLNTNLNQVLAACDANRDRDLADLIRLLEQPSISAQNIGIQECAELLQHLLTEIGLTTRLLPTAGHPMVYAEWTKAPGKPTVLIYGHYDVQPPDPLDAWISPPFQPTIRNGKLFARGVGDNKGQLFAQVAAVRAWLETIGALPVNVKLIFEGEEESGSPNLDSAVQQYRDLLAADLVYTSDGPVFDNEHPLLVFGVRGMLFVELHARGASHDLHSGNWGGVAPNPAWTLVKLLGTMLDAENTITIPGFTNDVQAPTLAFRAAMDQIPLDQHRALADIGLKALPPPTGLPYHDRLMTRPTLNIAGFTSGYGGEGSKTIIPATATVKIDMRLVPNQDPDDIYDKFAAHVARHAPDVGVRRLGSMRPSFTPVEHPYAEPIRRAIEHGFGRRPVDVPLLGGSLPDATWTQTLGLPSFVVPYANPDEDNHAPNENLELARFHNGIRTTAILLAELASLTDIPPHADRTQ